MVFTKLGTEALKLKRNHTEVYPTVRVGKILEVVRNFQIRRRKRLFMKQYQDG